MRLFLILALLTIPTFSRATPVDDLNRELDRILKARGYSTVLGIQVTQLGLAEDAYIEKMQFISPENYSAELRQFPLLAKKIGHAQQVLFEAFFKLEQYRDRFVDESQRRYEKLSPTERDYFDRVNQFIAWRAHTERVVSPAEEQSPIVDISPLKNIIFDLKEEQFHSASDSLFIDPTLLAQLPTAQQFLRRPHHLRVIFLKTLSKEAFTAFLFSMLIRSPKENGIYLPAAIKVIWENYDFSQLGSAATLRTDTEMNRLNQRLLSIYRLILRTGDAHIIDTGTANILEYSLVTQNPLLNLSTAAELNSSVFALHQRLRNLTSLSDRQRVLEHLESLVPAGKRLAKNISKATRKDLFKFSAMKILTNCQLLISEFRP